MTDARQYAPATARNREPIREVLARELPARGTVLEIASGTGEHAVHFARAFPHLTWQPSDVAGSALASIAAWLAEAQLPNLRAPLALDVTSATWPIDRRSRIVGGGDPDGSAGGAGGQAPRGIERADAIVCTNMVHIAPWEAALGLFAGAARLLPADALLYLYGPYRFGGAFTAPSNAEFDRSLRARDPRWGVRDVDELTTAAAAHGFALKQVIAMPANNHSLVFRTAAG
jgi:hypothetical protein